MGTFINIVSWLVFGLVVGAVARLILPGRQAMGCLMTAVLGIAGSFVGGAIYWMIYGTPGEPINPAGWLLSTLGALIVVFVYSRITGARAA